ncbi:MAG: anti-sigma factor [Candidatus Methylophosphatis roskildensis]
MNYRRPELRDRLASEYVLGTLHGRARARFRQLLRDDHELRNRVAFWERELIPMAAPLSAAAPSPKVWEQIAARVAPRERGVQARPGWIARWLDMRMVGSLAVGLLIGVTVALIGPALLVSDSAELAQSQLPESYVGVLATADGKTGMIVSSRRYGKAIDVKRVRPVPVPAGRTLYLWTIAADGAVRAIGPVPDGDFVQVALGQTSEALFSNAAELALSVEPVGSMPTTPGGAYVYRGLCGKTWRVKSP